jgi:hypothetical protein
MHSSWLPRAGVLDAAGGNGATQIRLTVADIISDQSLLERFAMSFIKNVWYVAAWSYERTREKPIGRTIIAEFESASRETLAPRKLEGAMSFIFETCLRQKVTPYAAVLPELQNDYPRYGRRLEARCISMRRDRSALPSKG